MSYALDLASEVKKVLNEFSSEFAEQILDQIEVLAAHPTTLSRTVPGLPLQTFQFKIAAPAETFLITILFRYSQDEQTLHLLNMTTLKVDPD